MDEEDEVDGYDTEEEGEEGPVVPPVVEAEGVGQLLVQLLGDGLLGRGLRRYQPFTYTENSSDSSYSEYFSLFHL